VTFVHIWTGISYCAKDFSPTESEDQVLGNLATNHWSQLSQLSQPAKAWSFTKALVHPEDHTITPGVPGN
jgi:hypothetical protein